MASKFLRGKTWWILFYENGRKVQYSLKTRDKKVADFRKREVEGRLDLGDSPLPNPHITAQQALEFYSAQSKNVKSAQAISDDERLIRKYFDDGAVYRLVDINEAGLRSYINKRIECGISTTTANHTIKAVKAFLNFCIRNKYLPKNQINGMKKYKSQVLPPKFLSKEQIQAVLKAAKGEVLYNGIVIAIYTGMRLGEIKRLKKEDFDLTKNSVTVHLSKSGRFRVIPIHKDLKKLLAASLGRLKPGQLVFDQIKNKRRVWRRICLRAGCYDVTEGKQNNKIKTPNIGWHTFRHTFASHLIMAGLDLVTVSKYLGHADIKTTMIYSHLSQDHLQEGIKKLQF